MTGKIGKLMKLFIRLFIVVLIMVVLYVDIIYIDISHLKSGLYEHWAFLVSAFLVLIPSIIISVKFRSPNALLYSAFSILISLGYLVHVYPVVFTYLPFPIFIDLRTIFMSIFVLIALIHFLIPSKITEPFLPLVIIISISWLYINLIYYNVFTFYAMYYFSEFSGDIGVAFVEISKNINLGLFKSILCIPFLAIFLLAKLPQKNSWLHA